MQKKPKFLTNEIQEQLKDPRISLPLYGKVMDQATSRIVPYDPFAITSRLQWDMLESIGNRELSVDGQLMWDIWLCCRQAGKSLVADLALYPLTMFSPGRFHVTIADEQKRADYLHSRVQLNHTYWPEELRVKQKIVREKLKLEFEHGGGMHAMAGSSNAVGVGYSPDSIHLSEVPLHGDASGTWNLLMPSIINRDDGYVVMESTPYPMSMPSSEFYRDLCWKANSDSARFRYHWYPYWDQILNRRAYNGEPLSIEEQRLMDMYSPEGLTEENLMFRRFIMDMDPEVRRNPALFDVFYLSNDVDCWLTASGGVIPGRALEGQSKNLKKEIEFIRYGYGTRQDDGLRRFKHPEFGAIYVIGVDPAGFGRDHSAFQVLEVWADGWEQVCSFGAEVDPLEFNTLLMKEAANYNQALVAIERNGIGMGAIEHFRLREYRNLYYDGFGKPGVHKSSHDKMVEVMIDALMDGLVLREDDTLKQLGTYGADKLVERTQAASILNPGRSGRRRERHHWDKVSALATACLASHKAPRRYRSTSTLDDVLVKPTNQWSYNDWEKYKKQVAHSKMKNRRR